jgi:hypothetical protein
MIAFGVRCLYVLQKDLQVYLEHSVQLNMMVSRALSLWAHEILLLSSLEIALTPIGEVLTDVPLPRTYVVRRAVTSHARFHSPRFSSFSWRQYHSRPLHSRRAALCECLRRWVSRTLPCPPPS